MMNDSDREPSVLFVDDEIGILKALRRIFMDEDWDLFFAASGKEGLEILAENQIDLVVSDVRMPEMDGIEFINRVRERYPQIIRIFLTGYADKQSMVKALADGNAQQVLAKPWDEGELKEVVRNALDQACRQRLKNKEFQKIINSLSSLPPMPQTFMEVRKYLGDPETFSLTKAGDIIERDVSLSAELIRWANSALFGQMHKVETVHKSLVVLGSEIAKGILLAGSLFKTDSGRRRKMPGFNESGFYTHSVACAILAKKLIESSPFDTGNMKDRAFTAGLLHDIGKLVEQRCLPEQFQEIIGLAEKEKQRILWAEQQVLGTTHEEIGACLAEWWNMPSFLSNAIRWHHLPEECHFDRELIHAVHVADCLAHQFRMGSSGNFQPVEIEESRRSMFDLGPEQLETLKEEVNRYLS